MTTKTDKETHSLEQDFLLGLITEHLETLAEMDSITMFREMSAQQRASICVNSLMSAAALYLHLAAKTQGEDGLSAIAENMVMLSHAAIHNVEALKKRLNLELVYRG